MGQLQKTFDGELLDPDRVEFMRYTPKAPIRRYSVEFNTPELVETLLERVRIEEREIDGVSPKQRAIYAARQQSVWDDLELVKVTRYEELDTKRSDESFAEMYVEENH